MISISDMLISPLTQLTRISLFLTFRLGWSMVISSSSAIGSGSCNSSLILRAKLFLLSFYLVLFFLVGTSLINILTSYTPLGTVMNQLSFSSLMTAAVPKIFSLLSSISGSLSILSVDVGLFQP